MRLTSQTVIPVKFYAPILLSKFRYTNVMHAVPRNQRVKCRKYSVCVCVCVSFYGQSRSNKCR